MTIHACDWRELSAIIDDSGGCDAVITDPPYSERCHRGHGDVSGTSRDGCSRADLPYAHWTPREVRAFCAAWHPLTRGWIVAMTDHVLAPAWCAALERVGRYVFSPLAYVHPGSRVRLSGDGPAQWSVWIVVARRKGAPLSGARPGAYVQPPWQGDDRSITGGKTLWIMERLIEDYSARGDLVVDPCCGAGTTLVAAERLGRRYFGADADPDRAEMARKRIARTNQIALAL